MKMIRDSQDGFTIIEIIITLIMFSFAGLMLVSTFGTATSRSSDPLNVAEDNYTALRAIERVNADYRARLGADPNQAISVYVDNDLSGVVTGLSGAAVSGEYIDFSAPDVNRKVTEVASANSMYVKVTAVAGSSRLVTILGN